MSRAEYRNPPPERKALRILAPGLVLLALGAALPAGAEGGGGTATAIEGGIALLHEGRFDEAEEAFDQATHRPEAAAFFRAFTVYWRILYDRDNVALETKLEERLVTALTRAEDALRREPGNPEATLCAGTSRLLLAELRAKQKKVFAAGSEAKKAKRLLEAGYGSASVAPDSAFGLGTYNYMADRAPTFVKGLRALLFLPGGDRSAGLAQLERAARSSRYFRLEARILLSTIYASKHERLYADASREARAALEAEVRSVAALDGAARLHLMLAEPERATALLEEAAQRIDAAPRTAASVVAAVEYQRARAEFAMLRPDLARRRLRSLLSRRGLPHDLAEDATRLSDTCASVLGAAARSWEGATPHLDRLAEAPSGADPIAALLELAKRTPGDPVLSLLAGRALLRSGRGEEAFPLLVAAATSTSTPRPLSGLSRVLAGQAADLTGRRAKAIDLYRSAIEAPSFVGREAAYLYQKTPFRRMA
jgi:tetratricopeptide (TPR) repeat protein